MIKNHTYSIYKNRLIFTSLLFLLILPSLYCGDLTTAEKYDTLLYYQKLDFQDKLNEILPASNNYFITGSLDPTLPIIDKSKSVFSTVRIIAYDLTTCIGASEYVHHDSSIHILHTDRDQKENNPGYSGIIMDVEWDRDTTSIQFLTTQQNRFLIWYGNLLKKNYDITGNANFDRYAEAVSVYLTRDGNTHNDPAKIMAANYNLSVEYDLYAEPPDYVIEGYQNYKDYLYSYDEIKTEFAHGITAFIPTGELLQWFKDDAPHEAFPNKEAARLQEEYSKFFRRGGDVRTLQTLTKIGFDTLKTGEYFFAVGVNGAIRFGREMPREEVQKIEEATGHKGPRANHAFLFPGEAVLTAGAFFIDENATNKLVKINAQSGHYFYSNIAPTIREDIAERSDYYLLTLGHFFIALDRLGIPYDNILISKL